MPIAPFICAMGDAPEVTLPVADVVAIAPANNSVDTNRVTISGKGTITSLGTPACGGLLRSDILDPDEDEAATDDPITITKRVTFDPQSSEEIAGQRSTATIILKHNPPALVLLGGIDRTIAVKAFGDYQSDADGNWTEIAFTSAATSPTQGGGQLLALLNYTSSQTITIPPGATRAWVRMWGPSGASANGLLNSASGGSSSAGVGSGGYLEKFLTGLTPGNTMIFTLGVPGVVNATTGAGGDATNTQLASGTQTLTVPLIAGGSQGTPVPIGTLRAQLGSVGGTATGGDINLIGQSGSPSIFDGSVTIMPGIGGVRGLARGPDGSALWTGVSAGKPGLAGGLIIGWFNDAVL